MQSLLDGLSVFVVHPAAWIALVAGTVVGVIVGLTPGLSSRSALLIAIPFLLSFDPLVAAIFLISLHASSQISGTVPAAIFGVPTSASEAASVVDGYPLAKRGESSRVFGAIISSSAVGGLLGAAVLLAVGPLAARLVLNIGSPEIAALSAGGLLAIAAVSSSGLAAGVALGAAGILASTVGVHAMTGVARFTFGQDGLDGGISAPALIAGMMALPELLRREAVPVPGAFAMDFRSLLQGTLAPFQHLGLTVRSAVIGLLVGITPGIGSSVAAWLSYGQATRTVRPSVPFGEGAIEGVVAPETGSGSKEGGALIPTLFLGIPGSSGMAILLSAFAIVGVTVGPGMLNRQPEFPAVVAYTVAGAEIFGLILCIVSAPLMMKLAALPRTQVAIVSLVGACLAAYYASPYVWSLLELLLFAVLGTAFARFGLARPPFLIGFVIGPIFETALLRSSQIYSWSALWRPGVLTIAALIVAAVAYVVWTDRRGRGVRVAAALQRGAAIPLVLLGIIFLLAIVMARSYPSQSSLMPIAAAIVGVIATGVATLGFRSGSRKRPLRFEIDPWLATTTGIGLLLATVIGPWGAGLPLVLLARPLAGIARWRTPYVEGASSDQSKRD